MRSGDDEPGACLPMKCCILRLKSFTALVSIMDISGSCVAVMPGGKASQSRRAFRYLQFQRYCQREGGTSDENLLLGVGHRNRKTAPIRTNVTSESAICTTRWLSAITSCPSVSNSSCPSALSSCCSLPYSAPSPSCSSASLIP